MDAYFAARAAQGFNAAWVNVVCTTTTGGRDDASTYDGIRPFSGHVSSGDYDLSTPVGAYFQRVDALVAAAAAHGFLLFLDPLEVKGFASTFVHNVDAAKIGYGAFLGARYGAAPNVFWMSGNDWDGNMAGDVDLVPQGIRQAGSAQLQTAEMLWPQISSTLDAPDWQPPSAGLNFSYTYNPTYALLLHDWDRTPHLPNVHIEGDYEAENIALGSHPTNAHDVRAQLYWALTSGAAGAFYGNHWEVFQLANATWASNMAGDQGAPQVAFVRGLLAARAWQGLAPDEAHVLLTAGRGTCMASTAPQGSASPSEQDNTCATAAATADGTLALAYLPTARQVTVAASRMAGSFSARWYDPTAGTYQEAPGSPFPNLGSLALSPPAGAHADGFADWVLVLETGS
jgi:hypothetical protein